MNRLDRYLLTAGFFSFIGILSLTVALLILNRLLKILPWLFEVSVPFTDVIGVFAWLIPSFLLYGLPIGAWFGWMVAFGRLGSDGEMTAFASVGTSPWRLVRAGSIISVGLFIIALAVAQWGYGQGRKTFQTKFNQLLQTATLTALRPGAVLTLPNKFTVAVAGSDTQKTLFAIKDPELILTARYATPLTDQIGLALRDGFIYLPTSKDSTVAHFGQGDFFVGEINLDDIKPGVREQSLQELWRTRQQTPAMAELISRLCLAFGVVLTPLWAFVLAARRTRSGKSSALFYGLVALSVYYGLFTLIKQAVLKQWLAGIPMLIGMNGILLFGVLFLFWRKSWRPGLP